MAGKTYRIQHISYRLIIVESLAETLVASRKAYTRPNDDFFQAGELYRRGITDVDRDHLIGNIVEHLGGEKNASSCGKQPSSIRWTLITGLVSLKA